MEPGTLKKETSPWVYIGCGCAALVILAMAGVAGMTWITYREAKKLEKSWSNPQEAEARTREVLVYDELPEGYYPRGTFSLPFVMDMAMLSDEPPSATEKPDGNGGFNERGFLYFRMRRLGKKSRELQDFMEGKGEPPEWLKGNADVDTQEVIRHGELDVNGQKIYYSANRGEVNQGRKSVEGIATMMMIDCPQDERVRFGVWFSPDPNPNVPADQADFTGTNADPEEIRKFASHFRFCPAT